MNTKAIFFWNFCVGRQNYIIDRHMPSLSIRVYTCSFLYTDHTHWHIQHHRSRYMIPKTFPRYNRSRCLCRHCIHLDRNDYIPWDSWTQYVLNCILNEKWKYRFNTTGALNHFHNKLFLLNNLILTFSCSFPLKPTYNMFRCQYRTYNNLNTFCNHHQSSQYCILK